MNARAPLAFYDGSVRIYQTGETNPGWKVNRQADRMKMGARQTWFKPQTIWEPALANTTMLGNVSGVKAPAGWYQYTRGGLMGWDVPRGPVRSKMVAGKGGNELDGTTAENELDTTTGSW